MNQWATNIRKFYYYKFFTVFGFSNPILIFYMLEKGMSLGSIFLLSSIQRIIGVVIEIPTGALSDLKGHKYNLMFGTLSFAISSVIFAFSSSFLHFLLAEVFMALSGAFISGADTAFVYETLEMNNAEETYEKIFGQMAALQSVVTAVIMLSSGFLAAISWQLPFFLGAAFAMAAFVIACTLVEPGLHQKEKITYNRERYREYFITIKNACKISFTNVELRWFLIFASFLSTGILVVEDFYQPYLKNALASPVTISGVIYALIYVGQAIFNNYTHLGLKKLGYERMFYLLPALPLVTALGMLFFKQNWVVLLFFLPYFSTGSTTTVVSGYINRRTTPGQRATVISLRQMLRKLVYSAFCPIIGWSSDLWGMDIALLLSGLLLIGTMLLPAFYKQKYHLEYDYAGVEVQSSVR